MGGFLFRHARIWLWVFVLGGLAACARPDDASSAPSEPEPPAPQPLVADPALDARWAEVDRLVGDQKMEAARQLVEELGQQAQAAGDDDTWARALITEVQLGMALGTVETAVRDLKTREWPKAARARAALNLFYGQALVAYYHAYAWEIGQREHVERKDAADLKAWTRDELIAEAARAYAQVWAQRQALGREPVAHLARYIAPNTYPPRIRGTLRDAVSYLFVQLLADTSLWRADHAAEVYRLDLAGALTGKGDASLRDALADPTIHPLRRILAILGDLEAWHAQEGHREAAFEAHLERARQLTANFTDLDDRARIRAALEARLVSERGVEWWSMGMAEVADLVRAEEAPDSLIRARQTAEQGRAAYPNSIGGQRCTSIIQTIEAPDYQLAAMAADGPKRRSIEVTHRNLDTLHFRAYPVDLLKSLAGSRDYQLLPNDEQMRKLVQSAAVPAKAWTATLAPTPDHRLHRTFVTPPLDAPGLYLIVASTQADFGSVGGARALGVYLIVGDLALVVRPRGGGVEVSSVSGETGAALAGVEVMLWRFDWQEGHQRIATATTGADGLVSFPHVAGRERAQHLIVARQGKHLAIDRGDVGFHSEPRAVDATATLMFSDRSVYRPGQTLRWKVVTYRGGAEVARFRVQAQTAVKVTLRDSNGETVAVKTVTTNAYGSAAGEFIISTGRALGAWSVQSSHGGAASIRVEEYKRPTFEVQLQDPAGALRLNRPATLEGDARYYFGLPLTEGQVRWRVVREPVYPWWWGWYGRGVYAESRTIAAGTSPIGEDGRFRLTFKAEADERTAKTPEISYRYRVQADVTDEGGETRSASRSFRLGFSSVEATIASPATFVRQGQAAAFTLLRTNLDGVPKAGEGTWRVVALQQPSSVLLPAEQPLPPTESANAYRTPGDALRSRQDPGYAPEAVLRAWADGAEAGRGRLQHDAKGEAALTLPTLPPGAWRLHYRTVDDFGTPYTTSQEFIVAASSTPVALPLLLKVERASVNVGGTARLLVHSAVAGLPITLDIEKGGRRIERRVLIAGQSPALIEIPIGADDRGGFGVTASALRDHQLMTLSQSVFVPWDDKELKLDFATFRDTLRPGARETWRVTVKRPDGAAAEAGAAELLAYMYDRSLDAFAPHTPPSPLSLYPTRTEVSWVRASLGSAPGLWLWDNGFGSVSAPPALDGDRLRFFDDYAIGGPGVRHQMMMRRGMAHDSLMSAPPPPPPSPVAAPAMALEAAAVGRVAAKQERDEQRVMANGAVALADQASASAPPIDLRSNFAETAFWQPQLLTGPDGSATIEFQVPDSVTSWNVWVHAITRDLRGASVRREVRTVKDLMIRPYLPRFLRESDEAQLKVLVNNAGKAALSGDLDLEIFDPVTNEDLRPAFGIAKATQPFAVAAGGGQSVVFALKAPRGVRTVAFKVTARAADLSDGELRALPVLPSRMHLVQSRFAALKGAQRRELTFEDMKRTQDPSRVDDTLVVTLDAQLFYGVLQALPYLADYPYECVEQTLNRYLSTGIVTSVFHRYPSVAKMAKELSARDTPLETWEGADPNRRMALEETPWVQEAKGGPRGEAPALRILDPKIAHAEQRSALAKLAKAQTSLGAFPWWPGGPPSPYMTLYTVHGFSKGLEFGVQPPKDVVTRAWQYLHRHYLDDIVRDSMKDDCCWEFVTLMNYTLSNFPDPSWTGGVFSDTERNAMLAFSFRHWKEHSPYLKAYLALTLHRMGRRADAMLVFDSIMDSAKTDVDLGTYWAPEDRSWLWYNDTTETHAFALRALMELKPQDPRRDGMVQWLFLNKQLNHWKSTRATAEVIYSLVHYLQAEGQLGARESARVELAGRTTEFTFEPDRYSGKAAQVMVAGDAIDPKSAATVVVSKDTPGILFASATWHYSTEQLPDQARGDLFGVTRRYFRRENHDGQFTLTPLADGADLAPGDELEVQLSIRAKHAAEYVHLRDPRAAGLEPGVATSGYKGDLGLVWYEEIRDSGTNFFFERLPAGEYTLKYRTRANMGGTFRVGPATLQSMYAPEFAAFSAGSRLTIRPGGR
ncbi:MAG: hypothetical protein K0Q76_831 [Panacagrimonas sp.]|nr:alpha-2-macroglobulin family protein [Panacagrimonas sp.]MCC2655723.1 hypothetical protein [Panacagrimonas sp.]